MDIKQLEAFVAIAKLKSFSKAAESLYITQPTISTHIKNLEYELNATLIDRSSKKIYLTQAGDILYKYAVDILNSRDYAIYSLNDYNGRIEGLLEISASSVPEEYLLPDMLMSFNEIFPDVNYKIFKYDSGIVIDKILQGEINFGIVGSKIDSKKLEYLKIMSDEIILAAPPLDMYSSVEITPDELKNFKFILREKGSGSRKALEEALSKQGIFISDLTIRAFIENNRTIVQCLKKNMGLTFISRHAVLKDLNEGSLIIIPVKDMHIFRDFYFVYNRTIALSPLAEAFKTFVINRCCHSSHD
ncbi:MAG: LysR family transcriptional regulator [Peptostreptococcaceae bacterium]|nr:LysR family transcriptional regulator [Peptostreptococcaceae bacterium]